MIIQYSINVISLLCRGGLICLLIQIIKTVDRVKKYDIFYQMWCLKSTSSANVPTRNGTPNMYS